MRSTNKTVNSVDLEVAREMLALSESKWFGLDVAWVRILDQCECFDCAVGSSVTVQIMRYEDEEWVELCGGKAGLYR